MRTKTRSIEVLFSPEEYQMLRQRMEQAGVQFVGPFIRKMALDGYIVRLDTSDIREMTSLLRRCSNNLNQIAKKANATGSIYGADIAALQARQDEIWEMTKEILARLSSIQ
jgi:hypothetical protein